MRVYYKKCSSSNGSLLSSGSIKMVLPMMYLMVSTLMVKKWFFYCGTTKLLNVIFIDGFDWSTTVLIFWDLINQTNTTWEWLIIIWYVVFNQIWINIINDQHFPWKIFIVCFECRSKYKFIKPCRLLFDTANNIVYLSTESG